MKLPEREFKVGDRVWSIECGFGTIDELYKGKRETLVLKGFGYTKNGKSFPDNIHRSLFTPEEAKELFGVEEEKPKQKVKRWQYWFMYENYERPRMETEYFSSDLDFLKYHPICNGFKFGRIDESMREFEE